MKKRKISLVIEETGGKNFNFYMEGDKERLSDKSIKESDLGTAEFWALKLFQICIAALKRSGAANDRSN